MTDYGALPDFSVKGLHVLITGGTGGIGGAFARAFAANGATATVTDVKPPASALPKGVEFVELDVRDDQACAALPGRIARLDALIHCAGRLDRDREWQTDGFKDIVDIHLVGAMRLAMAFRAKLKASRGGIINIGSVYSYFGAPHLPAYTAAKTAIVGLTRSLAQGFAEDGIRVNAIAPGLTMSDIFEANPGEITETKFAFSRNLRSFKRDQVPGDLVGAAVFLASAESDFMSGQTIVVDGGAVMH
jgi:NAD(P)-dependent dehydrogenase (short-subunit alcohol dehydrogenase family)